MDLMFSLIDIASAQYVPFDILQYVRSTYHGLVFVAKLLLCPSSFHREYKGANIQ